MKPARYMTDAEIARELDDLEREWKAMHSDPEFDGHSGSPGEGLVERMSELETEQKRRPTPGAWEGGR